MNIRSFWCIFVLSVCFAASAQTVVPLAYGDMDRWVRRNIRESHVLGGNEKICYAVGPSQTIDGDVPYENLGGSPWATSNVLAKVVGITKVSNAVFPDERGTGKCAKLTTLLDHCKAAGIINIDVMVAGTMFLGRMFEPLKSTSDPYKNMEMGIAFTGRPQALVFDYKLYVPEGNTHLYSDGFKKKKTLPGSDRAEVFIFLQRRWEDSDGGLHAKRVGTGRELFGTTTDWVNGYHLKLHYGDISGEPFFKSYMGLIPEKKSYCARNSKGKVVPVIEEGWDSADATPTHMIVMFSAGSGDPYTGTPGLTLWVDNVGLYYSQQ